MAALDVSLEDWLPGLTAAPAYPHLRGQLAVRWVDGAPPRAMIEQATWYRGKQSLFEAEDPAAALSWRIAGATPPSHRDAPLPWLPGAPPALRQDTETSEYLDRLTHRIDELMQRVVVEAQQSGASDRAPWQRTLPPGADDRLIGDLAVWRAAHGIPPTDPHPTGPPMKDPDAARHQARLVRRLSAPSPLLRRPKPDAAGEHLRTNQRRAEHHTFEGPSVSGPRR